MLTGKHLQLTIIKKTAIGQKRLIQHHPQLANSVHCLPAPVIIGKDKGLFRQLFSF